MNDNSFDRLVSENYHLIHTFLRVHRYHGDAYYDAAVDGLLEAARRFCKYPELQDLGFEAIAFRKMKDYVCSVTRKESRRREIVPTFSLDQLISKPNYSFSIADLCDPTQNTENTVVENLLLAEMLSFLTEKEIEAYRLKHSGYSYSEIASRCGINNFGVKSRFYRIRDKLRKLNLTMEWI